MSKFITSSANYSEANLLKSKLLKPILEEYNKILINGNNNNFAKTFDKQMFIPNNNKKYYLFVVNKSAISDTQKSNYKILYFFPNKVQDENVNLLEKNLSSDFFMEIDSIQNFNKSCYLFEGYLYNNGTNFLVTDILAIDNQIMNCDYVFRLNTLNDIIGNGINNINCHMNISIHPVFPVNETETEIDTLFYIFKNNFVYANEINSIEYLYTESHIKTQKIQKHENEIKTKTVKKTKYSDVFKVYNTNSGDEEGILYIKNIVISKKIRELTKDIDTVILNCEYNHYFFKWSPVFT
jgi:hypothetical protein